MGALRSSRPALLSASGIVPSEHTTGRGQASARVDHQGRLHARQTAAGRGRLPLPPRSGGRCGARAPPARPSTPRSSASPGARNAGASARWRQLKDARHKPGGVVAVTGRPRARRVLLGDRHLVPSSRSGSAGIPAGGRPPHAHSLAPAQAHTRHPQEAHQLALSSPSHTNPAAAGEAARASRLAHTTPRFVA